MKVVVAAVHRMFHNVLLKLSHFISKIFQLPTVRLGIF